MQCGIALSFLVTRTYTAHDESVDHQEQFCPKLFQHNCKTREGLQDI